MKHTRLEFTVGVFLVLGLLSFGWLALRLGEVSWLSSSRSYVIYAEFDNISGVKTGADVQVAGVVVGSVRDISLTDDAVARAALQVNKSLKVPVDSIASVKSQGIIGDKYIQLTLGGDDEMFKAGATMTDTESSVDLESLISKFAFGKVK